jgi:hypothetical protein
MRGYGSSLIVVRYARTIRPYRIEAIRIESLSAPSTVVVLVTAYALLLLALWSFSLIRRSPMRRRQRFKSADQLRVWGIGRALIACILGALLGLAVLTWAALALLHFPKLPRGSTISIHDLVSVLQLVFASVAGAGALVALVMAYRRQKVAEVQSQHDRTRLLNERFTAITAQIGDQEPSIRMAGVYAMAGLADDWEEKRQTCIDVLCAYLRMPHYSSSTVGGSSIVTQPFRGRAEREIRQTIIRLVAGHLRRSAAIRWDNIDFDFTGVVFDHDVDFNEIILTSGNISFQGARFLAGIISFIAAGFCGGTINFNGAHFAGADFNFDYAEVSDDAYLSFDHAEFARGTVSFMAISLSETSGRAEVRSLNHTPGARPVWLRGKPAITSDDAIFNGATVNFDDAELSAGVASFTGITFSSGVMSFYMTEFGGVATSFDGARFDGGTVSFDKALFSGRAATILPRTTHEVHRNPREGVYSSGGTYAAGLISFKQTHYSGSTVLFCSRFVGCNVDFQDAVFSQGSVSFEDAVFAGRAATPWDDVPNGKRAGVVTFNRVKFTGAEVVLKSKFQGGTVDLTRVSDWTCPPDFGKIEIPCSGLDLPKNHAISSSSDTNSKRE